ncbi:hypothetical protein NT6N_14990 [Oceaniferula spumae]|uniref:Multi-ubiquitin domain-containing protein n=1 Tax=Oceaniferula spumae TaxID=2979115 RepID=A0AAT9FKA6_9BACT
MNQNKEDKDTDLEDLEVCAKEGRKPRCVRRYRIRIDKDRYIVNLSHMTGLQLLEKAGKCDPTCWRIHQKLKGGKLVEIQPDEKVDFTTPGIERFVTTPCDQTDGSAPRREFSLPACDVDYLNDENLRWELIGAPGNGYVLVNNFPVPKGYNHSVVTAALRVETNYPDTQLDMVYFYPALQRVDGKAIPALAGKTIDNKSYQRWSRHRTPKNAWRPGVDYLGTHLVLVRHWLEREFTKRP